MFLTNHRSVLVSLNKFKSSTYFEFLRFSNLFHSIPTQIFSLESPETFQCNYSPSFQDKRVENMNRIAEQVATLCVTLGEYPSIRYRSDWKPNFELAQLVQQKLEAYKLDEPTLGESPEKSKSTLLILDRGFDCVSPLLHELTLQAMAYDLLPISEDVFKYENHGIEKDMLLDESDEMWCQFRHQHIAVVSKEISNNLKTFEKSDPMASKEAASTSNLTRILKKEISELPQHQKKLSQFAAYLKLAEDCINVYKVGKARK